MLEITGLLYQNAIYLELLAISIIDVAISITVQRRIASVEKTYMLQAKMKRHMDELKELTNNKAPNEHLIAKQKEITDTMTETTMHQLRATPVLLVVSIFLYFLILPNLFPSATVNTLPIIGYKYHGFEDNYYFIGVTFVISLAVQLALGQRDKKRFAPKLQPKPQEPVKPEGAKA